MSKIKSVIWYRYECQGQQYLAFKGQVLEGKFFLLSGPSLFFVPKVGLPSVAAWPYFAWLTLSSWKSAINFVRKKLENWRTTCVSGSFCACSHVCGGKGKKNACTCKIHSVTGSGPAFVHPFTIWKEMFIFFSSCSEHTSMLIHLSAHSWGRDVSLPGLAARVRGSQGLTPLSPWGGNRSRE